jgi:two-component system, OmpR family, KDP operon response regulator KdpE
LNKFEILIIDDEAQIQKLLRILLENNNYKVVQALHGQEGLQLAAYHPPDLIMLDLGLPDKSGQEVLVELRAWYTRPVIILSVQNSEEDIVKALDAGATDYVIKPFRTGELLARMRSALRRSNQVNAEQVITLGDLEIDLVGRTVTRNSNVIRLTTTEFNLLALLARNEGQVLTHQYILKEIWGPGYQDQTQYLRVFIARLRKKLEDNPNAPQHIITESGVGYRLR